MELFEEIRRDHTHGTCTIRAVAKKLGVPRRMVRQALANAIPPDRKLAVRNKLRLDPVMEFIDETLRAGQLAPRWRHTVHRIWERIRQESSDTVAEATVRRYMQRRKQELGLTMRETFVRERGEEGSARASARGGGTLGRLPLPLPITVLSSLLHCAISRIIRPGRVVALQRRAFTMGC